MCQMFLGQNELAEVIRFVNPLVNLINLINLIFPDLAYLVLVHFLFFVFFRARKVSL